MTLTGEQQLSTDCEVCGAAWAVCRGLCAAHDLGGGRPGPCHDSATCPECREQTEAAMRYYLEIIEDGHRLPTGDRKGYATLEEAKAAAERHTDDALPRNDVRVYAHVATASLGGDGEPYIRSEP